MNKWCEHWVWSTTSLGNSSRYYWMLRYDGHSAACEEHTLYMFCPFCGTSRPKEKELWEKFYDEGLKLNWWKGKTDAQLDGLGYTFCLQLAKIAEEHLKNM